MTAVKWKDPQVGRSPFNSFLACSYIFYQDLCAAACES